MNNSNIDVHFDTPDPEREAQLEEVTTAYNTMVWNVYGDHLKRVKYPYYGTSFSRKSRYNPANLPLKQDGCVSLLFRKNLVDGKPAILPELEFGPMVEVGPFIETDASGGSRSVERHHWVDAEGRLWFHDEDAPLRRSSLSEPDTFEELEELIRELRQEECDEEFARITGHNSGLCTLEHVRQLEEWVAQYNRLAA